MKRTGTIHPAALWALLGFIVLRQAAPAIGLAALAVFAVKRIKGRA